MCRQEEGRWKIEGRKYLHKAWLYCKVSWQGSMSKSHLYFCNIFQIHSDMLKVKCLFSASLASSTPSLKRCLDSFWL